MAALAFTRANLGPRGLPRSGFSDWDDTLNVDHGSGRAESVWCGMQLCRALLDLGDLAEQIGLTMEADALSGDAPRDGRHDQLLRVGRGLVRALASTTRASPSGCPPRPVTGST